MSASASSTPGAKLLTPTPKPKKGYVVFVVDKTGRMRKCRAELEEEAFELVRGGPIDVNELDVCVIMFSDGLGDADGSLVSTSWTTFKRARYFLNYRSCAGGGSGAEALTDDALNLAVDFLECAPDADNAELARHVVLVTNSHAHPTGAVLGEGGPVDRAAIVARMARVRAGLSIVTRRKLSTLIQLARETSAQARAAPGATLQADVLFSKPGPDSKREFYVCDRVNPERRAAAGRGARAKPQAANRARRVMSVLLTMAPKLLDLIPSVHRLSDYFGKGGGAKGKVTCLVRMASDMAPTEGLGGMLRIDKLRRGKFGGWGKAILVPEPQNAFAASALEKLKMLMVHVKKGEDIPFLVCTSMGERVVRLALWPPEPSSSARSGSSSERNPLSNRNLRMVIITPSKPTGVAPQVGSSLQPQRVRTVPRRPRVPTSAPVSARVLGSGPPVPGSVTVSVPVAPVAPPATAAVPVAPHQATMTMAALNSRATPQATDGFHSAGAFASFAPPRTSSSLLGVSTLPAGVPPSIVPPVTPPPPIPGLGRGSSMFSSSSAGGASGGGGEQADQFVSSFFA